MRIEELRWFVRLVEVTNVTRAADLLHVSQPTLSRALVRLETEFGTPLFERRNNRLILNRYGEILLAHATRAIEEVETATSRIGSLLDPTGGEISLTFVTSFGSWLVPELLEKFHRLTPNTRFTLRGSAADDVMASVRSGEADAGIMSPRPIDTALGWIPLAVEPLGLAVPLGHELAHRETVTAADLEGRPTIALRRQFGLRQIADAYLSQHGVTPNVTLEATELSTIWGLVHSGIGIAIMPDRTGLDGVVVIPFADNAAVRIAGLVYDPRRKLTAVGEQFIQFARTFSAAHPNFSPDDVADPG